MHHFRQSVRTVRLCSWHCTLEFSCLSRRQQLGCTRWRRKIWSSGAANVARFRRWKKGAHRSSQRRIQCSIHLAQWRLHCTFRLRATSCIDWRGICRQAGETWKRVPTDAFPRRLSRIQALSARPWAQDRRTLISTYVSSYKVFPTCSCSRLSKDLTL